MLFVSLTGTIATVSDELEWLFWPAVRSTAAENFSWQRQLEAARRAYPDYRFTYISAGEGSYLATQLRAVMPDGRRRNVFVDPGTNQVTAESRAVTFKSFMRAIHYYLFVPGDAIFYLISSLGIVLLASLVAGIAVYKKFWRGFFRMPRWGKGSRTVWGDVHRLAGLWSLPFVFIIGLTSVWYLVERAMYRAGLDPEKTLQQTILAHPASHSVKSLDEIVRTAENALPAYRVRSISLPRDADDAVVVQGQTAAWFVRERANRVAIDQHSGEVLATRHTKDQPAVELWSHMADPFHFGDFGGLWSKLLWVVFGLALCGLSVSGVIIYCQRMARYSNARTRKLEFLGVLKWPSLVAITVMPIAAFFLDWLPNF